MAIHVRDNRGGNWFWLHNAIVDARGAELGPYAGWIYVVLCRHADGEQMAWVSHRRMAEETGISDRKLRDELRRLEVLGLISIEQRLDERGQQTNLYTLLDPLASNTRGVAPHATPSAPPATSPGATDQAPWHGAPPMKKTQLTRPMEQESVAPLQQVWDTVLGDLKEQIVAANYERWLVRTQLIARVDGRAVVGVPDQICADQLARRFDPLLRRALADACGEPVAVEYQIAADGGAGG